MQRKVHIHEHILPAVQSFRVDVSLYRTWLKYFVNQIKTVYPYIILFYIKRFQILLIVYIFLVGLNFGKLRLNHVWIFS